jgi:hypothetical protein
MKKPDIIDLNPKARESLLKEIGDSNLEDATKDAVLNTIDFTIELQQQLKEAKISIANLQRLFGCDGETLKKLLQAF